MFKRILTAVAALFAVTGISALANDIDVIIDGNLTYFETQPVIENGRTLVPMRAIFEVLGADVNWDGTTKTAYASDEDNSVSITIDSPVMYVDNVPVLLDVPARLINDSTLVPVRAVAESFGCTVNWDDTQRCVSIYDDGAGFISDVTEEIPPYQGSAYAVLNNNMPDFDSDDYTLTSYEYYSDTDEIGRCQTAYGCISRDTMPTEERGDISSVKPTGWMSVSYDFIDGGYLYNRCHLIGYQLSAENANADNLITGTRYMNVEGMLPFENLTADYIDETGNHVLYRVTPDFRGDELVARGVQMEAMSVEDNGAGVCFNVYCYNVQPGIAIDYNTGMNAPCDISSEPASDVQTEGSYILNTRSLKFHYPDCSSVDKMSDKNKMEYIGTRDELISWGYTPCGICSP